MKPIALLIPAYNRHAFLERTLLSLKPELELLDIILVDDGSVPAIDIAPFADYPITLICLASNQGIARALNKGLEHIFSSGYEFIARLDLDDIALNQRFTKQLAYLRAHPDIGLVGSWCRDIRSDDSYTERTFPESDQQIRKHMHVRNAFVHPGIMLRTQVAKQVGFYSEHYPNAEDYEYFFRLLRVCKAHNLPEFLVGYRWGDAESIGVKNARSQTFSSQTFSGLRIKLRYFNIAEPQAYRRVIRSVTYLIWLMLGNKVQ